MRDAAWSAADSKERWGNEQRSAETDRLGSERLLDKLGHLEAKSTSWACCPPYVPLAVLLTCHLQRTEACKVRQISDAGCGLRARVRVIRVCADARVDARTGIP